MDRALREALEASEKGRAYLAKRKAEKAARASRVRARPGVREEAERRASTKKGKAKRRREVYAAVDARSGGHCEHITVPGGPSTMMATEHDHFWGRGKEPESVENVWHLCRACHWNKTHNKPDRATWILRFREHAERHGYYAQMAKCARSLALELAQHPRRTA